MKSFLTGLLFTSPIFFLILFAAWIYSIRANDFNAVEAAKIYGDTMAHMQGWGNKFNMWTALIGAFPMWLLCALILGPQIRKEEGWDDE